MDKKIKFSDIPGIAQSINEIIQKLPLAVAVINLDREIIAFNRAFFLIAGREVRQGTPHCYDFLNFEFCHTDCLAHMATKLGRSITWDESQGRRSNGDELIVRPTVVLITDSDQKIEGHILIFQNTTDEVHLYHNFRDSFDHLERRIEFFKLLNASADKFQKIKKVDVMFQRITEFVTSDLLETEFTTSANLSIKLKLIIECCQLIQKSDSDEFVVKKTSTVQNFNIDETVAQQLLESVLVGIEALEVQVEPSLKINFLEEKSLAGQLESIVLPLRSGSTEYGYLVAHRFSAVEDIKDLEKAGEEQMAYLELFAKTVGPYIENSYVISNLESMVDKRTRELNEKEAQLQESTRLASVGEVAGMVAHEVLNPMTAVLAKIRRLQGEDSGLGLLEFITSEWKKDFKEGGLSQLIENFKDIPEDSDIPLIEEDIGNIEEGISEIAEDLKFIEGQLHRIVGIVDNLRGLARKSDQSQTVDITDAIEQTVKMLEGVTKGHDIEVITDLQHISKVTCDSSELVQVVHNLSRNAFQAMEMTGTLTIATTETPKRVEIRIIDTGPGIPAEIVPKIFEMRFTTKSSKEGTGLGLSLSRRLLRQVMGDVELESSGGNGKGAVFLCWIPKNKIN